MESIPITLIVKAPNQQIEDQKINCETSWTINKLKQHLSEVYPSKPPRHEQKLIYSGQLLNDSSVLKDVLRQYEGQDIHTVHLVCATKNMTGALNRSKTVATNNSSKNMDTCNTSNSNNSNNNVMGNTVTSENYDQSDFQNRRNNSTIIDNRVPPFLLDGNRLQWTNTNNGQIPPQYYLDNLNQYQLQMAWMQQAYVQYMAQYMQLAGTQIPNVITNTSSLSTATNQQQPGQINNNNLQQQLQEPVNIEAIDPQLQQRQNPAAAQEPEERDWLDIFYTFSRALVLFSFVYFYSSPLRFIFVVLLVTVLYLYHSGYFRNVNVINNNNNNNNNVNANAANVHAEDLPAPSRLMLAWTFISTFFASLIPDIPNINV